VIYQWYDYFLASWIFGGILLLVTRPLWWRLLARWLDGPDGHGRFLARWRPEDEEQAWERSLDTLLRNRDREYAATRNERQHRKLG
jgi:hypothetical protein